MLKSLRLKNFFGFADETLHFHPNINILVGINGSGKSSFLRALQLLKTLTFDDLLPRLFIDEWGGFDAVCHAGDGSQGDEITLECEFDAPDADSNDTSFLLNFRYSLIFTKSASFDNYSLKEEKLVRINDNEDNITYLSVNAVPEELLMHGLAMKI